MREVRVGGRGESVWDGTFAERDVTTEAALML